MATEALDPMTVSIELDAAYAPSFFLNCLSYTSVMIDKKLAMSHEKDGDFGTDWLKTNEAGSGPFMLRSWKPNESVALETNENYWDGVPKIKRVLIRNVTESATQQLLLQKGDMVDLVVLDTDTEKRRISLGMKQLKADPWKELAERYPPGTIVQGKVKNLTDFGLFIGLDGGIDGMVHLSDLDWTKPGEEALKEYKKGDNAKAIADYILKTFK